MQRLSTMTLAELAAELYSNPAVVAVYLGDGIAYQSGGSCGVFGIAMSRYANIC